MIFIDIGWINTLYELNTRDFGRLSKLTKECLPSFIIHHSLIIILDFVVFLGVFFEYKKNLSASNNL